MTTIDKKAIKKLNICEFTKINLNPLNFLTPVCVCVCGTNTVEYVYFVILIILSVMIETIGFFMWETTNLKYVIFTQI